MDALAEAVKALEKAKKELFELDMSLEWEMKINYVNSAWVKSVSPPRRPECTSQTYGSEKVSRADEF